MKQWKSKKIFYCNCYVWAIRQVLRRGGWIAVRRARVCKGLVLHMAWLPPKGNRLYHFRPLAHEFSYLALWHKGYISLGEDNL